MKYEITGEELGLLNIELDQGEKIYSEAGAMSWMSDNLNMDTKARGGILKGIGRMFSGESFFLVEYSSTGGTATISFALEYPGDIIFFDLAAGQSIICQKDAFLVAEDSVDLSAHFHRKLGAGLFGGEGFVLQKLTGPGKAFCNVGGQVVEYDLKAGQRLKVDTGCVAMFEPTVKFDIQLVKGIKNILFGGEGLFFALLEGPGKVWLQSMPISTLAARIVPYIPVRGG